ncbi:DUF3087 family protein [Parathalassolituus penaei]|uniref:DUF3087 family protein n=1 Tax=Parathalassolituus penaei TaxID=2997323 RepID=A0A9X3EQU4_9GAMM|nr:DUF3087 family protein [Parathalassolituus penaei]MCY0967198.1 DUF3087 family protein [Parathalassolituus penaei]
MELRDINKTVYKKRLNRLQGSMVVALFVLGLGLAELYRFLWANGESSTFLNAAGVATALILVGGAVYRIRHQPWMSDIVYMWRLKQELNRIYRRSARLEKALAENQYEALCAQYFSLHGSRHLYVTEDNTLTLPELDEKIAAFDERLQSLGMTISIDDYEPSMLDRLVK